jgi:hypothetical protein
VVFEDVANHEDTLSPLGQADEMGAFFVGERERFLHEDVLPGFQALVDDLEMSLRGRRNGDSGDIARTQDLIYVGRHPAAWDGLDSDVPAGFEWIADEAQGVELGEVAGQVLAPVAAAYECYVSWQKCLRSSGEDDLVPAVGNVPCIVSCVDHCGGQADDPVIVEGIVICADQCPARGSIQAAAQPQGCPLHLLCLETELQAQLADSFGLTLTVAHYPTGASKWNPIEHRLYSEISKNWGGRAAR